MKHYIAPPTNPLSKPIRSCCWSFLVLGLPLLAFGGYHYFNSWRLIENGANANALIGQVTDDRNLSQQFTVQVPYSFETADGQLITGMAGGVAGAQRPILQGYDIIDFTGGEPGIPVRYLIADPHVYVFGDGNIHPNHNTFFWLGLALTIVSVAGLALVRTPK